MLGSATRRGLLLFVIMITAMATSAAAAEGEASFRRWGLGWGNWSPQYSYPEYNGPGLRYRTPSGWVFTLGAYFSTSKADGSDYDEGSYYDSANLDHSEPVSRLVVLESARLFRLHERLKLGPALRFTHSYSRSESSSERLSQYDDGIEWNYTQTERRNRGESYSIGLGLRPQLWPHPRVSVESSLFLFWQRTHSSTWYREVTETESTEPTERIDQSRDTSHGWVWSYPTPSVTMSLVLFFYF